MAKRTSPCASQEPFRVNATKTTSQYQAFRCQTSLHYSTCRSLPTKRLGRKPSYLPPRMNFSASSSRREAARVSAAASSAVVSVSTPRHGKGSWISHSGEPHLLSSSCILLLAPHGWAQEGRHVPSHAFKAPDGHGHPADTPDPISTLSPARTWGVAHCNAMLGRILQHDVVEAHGIVGVHLAACRLEDAKQLIAPVLGGCSDTEAHGV